MAWIESHTVLSRHRKLKELARSLRLKPVHAMGHLHALWHDALEQQEDGDLTRWSDELVAESSQFDGDAPQYVSLLQLSGWLDGRLIHDWLDYAGAYLTAKYHTNNREKLVLIWAKHGKEYGRKNLCSNKEVNGHSTLPDLTLPTRPITPPAAPPTIKRFAKPTALDVTSYAKTIGFKLDGAKFCDYYESKGWKVGSAQMKDWQACVRTWKSKAGEFSTPVAAVQSVPTYKEPIPDAKDLIQPHEIKDLLAGMAKGIRK